MTVNEVNNISADKDNGLGNLSKLLLDNLNSPSYNLSSEQIVWINNFMVASPESFTTITNDIKAITSDGKIDSHDIPLLIKLISDVYNSGAISSTLSNPTNIIDFVKFTLNVILDSEYLILPEIEKKVIKKIIDSSIALLTMNIGTKPDDNNNNNSYWTVLFEIIYEVFSSYTQPFESR